MSPWPGGALRVGVNLANPLLVSGRAADGSPEGVAPSLGAALAARARKRSELVTFPSAGRLAAATDWDVAFLAEDPARAAAIAFSPPYAEIEVRYLVHGGSPLASAAEVDEPGSRVIAESGSAYALWLGANLRAAELVGADGAADALARFGADPSAVLAGLLPSLRASAGRLPGAALLPGRVTTVRQAIGVPVDRGEAAAEVARFVREAVASGLVRELAGRYGVSDSLVIPRP